MRRAAAACWIVAGCAYLALEAVAAAGFEPRYGYGTQMISDLGRPGVSSLAPLMNTAFVVQGSLFLVAAILVSRSQTARSATAFVAFAVANAVGNVTVAIIHSGSPLHVAGAALAIFGGNAAILAGFGMVDDARWYRTASRSLAALGLTAFAALAVAPIPVLERVSVYTIIAWQLLSAVRLWHTVGDDVTT